MRQLHPLMPPLNQNNARLHFLAYSLRLPIHYLSTFPSCYYVACTHFKQVKICLLRNKSLRSRLQWLANELHFLWVFNQKDKTYQYFLFNLKQKSFYSSIFYKWSFDLEGVPKIFQLFASNRKNYHSPSEYLIFTELDFWFQDWLFLQNEAKHLSMNFYAHWDFWSNFCYL